MLQGSRHPGFEEIRIQSSQVQQLRLRYRDVLVWEGALVTVAVAVVLPLTPLGAYLGFVAPPPLFFLLLAGMVVVYLCAAEGVKQLFYRRFVVDKIRAA